jgi:hypothetical protein
MQKGAGPTDLNSGTATSLLRDSPARCNSSKSELSRQSYQSLSPSSQSRAADDPQGERLQSSFRTLVGFAAPQRGDCSYSQPGFKRKSIFLPQA